MAPTTGASPYHQLSEQHIQRHRQYNSPHPVRLVPQLQQQLHKPLEPQVALAQAGLEAYLLSTEQSRQYQTALVAVQALEHQRLLKSSQDGAESPPL